MYKNTVNSQISNKDKCLQKILFLFETAFQFIITFCPKRTLFNSPTALKMLRDELTTAGFEEKWAQNKKEKTADTL